MASVGVKVQAQSDAILHPQYKDNFLKRNYDEIKIMLRLSTWYVELRKYIKSNPTLGCGLCTSFVTIMHL
jgi:hypothetical protein